MALSRVVELARAVNGESPFAGRKQRHFHPAKDDEAHRIDYGETQAEKLLIFSKLLLTCRPAMLIII